MLVLCSPHAPVEEHRGYDRVATKQSSRICGRRCGIVLIQRVAGAFAVIGHYVHRVVPEEVPILARENVALKRADDRRVC